MSKMYDAQEVKRRLRRIANEKGHEYVYQHPTYEDEFGAIQEVDSCTYSDALGQPSCIIGVLLSETVPTAFEKLRSHEWDRGTTLIFSPAVHMLTLVGASVNLREHFTDEAIQVMTVAQRLQDDGLSWGEAVTEAERVLT